MVSWFAVAPPYNRLMHPVIDQHRDALAELCRRHHVARLDVFGSAATGDFDPQRSDIDLLVEFADVPEAKTFRAYFALLADLEALFGRPVDLVEPVGVRNQYYWKGINATRRELFDAAA